MACDIVLDEGDGGWVVVEGRVLRSQSSDLMLDSPARRVGKGGPYRRALVHDHQDGLTVNYGRDYPGGVTVNDARVNLHVEWSQTPEPQLPLMGTIGDLRMVVCTHKLGGQAASIETTLWLCVPSTMEGKVMWQQVQLGPAVSGSL